MLPHRYSLAQEREFARVKKEGKTLQSESFGASFIYEGENIPSRFGFIVSNKISKLAVERNRIKRAMKEGVRRMLEKVDFGFLAVFFAKPTATKRTGEEITNEVKEVITKII